MLTIPRQNDIRKTLASIASVLLLVNAGLIGYDIYLRDQTPSNRFATSTEQQIDQGDGGQTDQAPSDPQESDNSTQQANDSERPTSDENTTQGTDANEQQDTPPAQPTPDTAPPSTSGDDGTTPNTEAPSGVDEESLGFVPGRGGGPPPDDSAQQQESSDSTNADDIGSTPLTMGGSASTDTDQTTSASTAVSK